MQQLQDACEDAQNYPMNLVHRNIYQHSLQDYHNRLNEREKDLFRDKENAIVDFWELDHKKGFYSTAIKSLSDLKSHLWKDAEYQCSLPRCRFMFMTAPHSRERLKISRFMLSYAFTYNQVLPGFLDFVFPFGKTEFARDSQYSGLRHESSIDNEEFQSLTVSELGRSGRDIRICYSLKSVESSKANAEWPWSIRSMAVYHSFDVMTGHTEWVIVKGNTLMKSRIASATNSHKLQSMTTFDTVEDSFASSLGFHQLFGDWSAEGWRWYINFLEDEFQGLTRHALAIVVDNPAASISTPDPTMPNRFSTFSSTSTVANWHLESSEFKHEKSRTPSTYSTSLVSPLSPIAESPFSSMHMPIPDVPQPSSSPPATADFSFSDLQKLQTLEEKAAEVLFTLKSNSAVLSELSDSYSSLSTDPNSPPYITTNSKSLSRFANRIAILQKELSFSITRTKSLLKLLANRKTLLYAILEYRNMQASRLVAERAQMSTDNVEGMTRDMHKIAKRTQQETVSMRIITLVTLFFLPGTFISTVMSTDIIRWNPDADGRPIRTVSTGALWLYLTITLPLMVGTFLAWYGVYWWVNTKDKPAQGRKEWWKQKFRLREKRLKRVGTA
ncbi:hypothetical protein CC78DRAFT_567210 [Lojkania enalia]|uniref:CorA-like transporter domain-containing protein n=1 Tax=Lojkania enalia TaxID=147567 RepID=A0A9P4KAV8_9PLEO|nr:hypothetical protein CC78DRAFT_567210 [Didymosphaeria enalia]